MARLLAVSELEAESTYLTDGERLFRVLRAWAPSGQVLLEDSGDLSAPAVALPVSELARLGMRVVDRATG